MQTPATGEQPYYFTGEMVYPSYFEDFAALRPFAGVAAALHEADGWSSLYDADRLKHNVVPTAAAVYAEVRRPCRDPTHYLGPAGHICMCLMRSSRAHGRMQRCHAGQGRRMCCRGGVRVWGGAPSG